MIAKISRSWAWFVRFSSFGLEFRRSPQHQLCSVVVWRSGETTCSGLSRNPDGSGTATSLGTRGRCGTATRHSRPRWRWWSPPHFALPFKLLSAFNHCCLVFFFLPLLHLMLVAILPTDVPASWCWMVLLLAVSSWLGLQMSISLATAFSSLAFRAVSDDEVGPVFFSPQCYAGQQPVSLLGWSTFAWVGRCAIRKAIFFGERVRLARNGPRPRVQGVFMCLGSYFVPIISGKIPRKEFFLRDKTFFAPSFNSASADLSSWEIVN